MSLCKISIAIRFLPIQIYPEVANGGIAPVVLHRFAQKTQVGDDEAIDGNVEEIKVINHDPDERFVVDQVSEPAIQENKLNQTMANVQSKDNQEQSEDDKEGEEEEEGEEGEEGEEEEEGEEGEGEVFISEGPDRVFSGEDPFDLDAIISQSRALDSTLWELHALRYHYHPAIARMAMGFEVYKTQ